MDKHARIKDWTAICKELSGNSLEQFEELRKDPDVWDNMHNLYPSVEAPEIKTFVYKRMSELRIVQLTTGSEEVWEFRDYVDEHGYTLTIR